MSEATPAETTREARSLYPNDLDHPDLRRIMKEARSASHVVLHQTPLTAEQIAAINPNDKEGVDKFVRHLYCIDPRARKLRFLGHLLIFFSILHRQMAAAFNDPRTGKGFVNHPLTRFYRVDAGFSAMLEHGTQSEIGQAAICWTNDIHAHTGADHARVQAMLRKVFTATIGTFVFVPFDHADLVGMEWTDHEKKLWFQFWYNVAWGGQKHGKDDMGINLEAIKADKEFTGGNNGIPITMEDLRVWYDNHRKENLKENDANAIEVNMAIVKMLAQKWKLPQPALMLVLKSVMDEQSRAVMGLKATRLRGLVRAVLKPAGPWITRPKKHPGRPTVWTREIDEKDVIEVPKAA